MGRSHETVRVEAPPADASAPGHQAHAGPNCQRGVGEGCSSEGLRDLRGDGFDQARLRRIAEDTGLSYERLRWDVRNRLSLCERHHMAHHSGVHRVPLATVSDASPKFLQFVRELDRAYP